MTLNGELFELIKDTKAATTEQLKTLTKEHLQKGFRKWPGQWGKCVWGGGVLVFGVNSNVSLAVVSFKI